MSFEKSRRNGKYWEDTQELDKFIRKWRGFQTTGKSERDFEIGLANSLMTLEDNFHFDIISQVDQETTVDSVYCFGKKHRPDMAIGEKSIAIELNLVDYSGLKRLLDRATSIDCSTALCSWYW